MSDLRNHKPRISVAPMMGWTDRHDRYFLRLISPHALLYTVMLTTGNTSEMMPTAVPAIENGSAIAALNQTNPFRSEPILGPENAVSQE